MLERVVHCREGEVNRTHGAKLKASWMVRVDQFVADRGRLRQDPEPADRIDPFECLDRRRFYAGAADTMESVAAGNEIASYLVRDTVRDVSDARMLGVDIMRLDGGGFINRGQPSRLARVHQVERHLGLAVD